MYTICVMPQSYFFLAWLFHSRQFYVHYIWRDERFHTCWVFWLVWVLDFVFGNSPNGKFLGAISRAYRVISLVNYFTCECSFFPVIYFWFSFISGERISVVCSMKVFLFGKSLCGCMPNFNAMRRVCVCVYGMWFAFILTSTLSTGIYDLCERVPKLQTNNGKKGSISRT